MGDITKQLDNGSDYDVIGKTLFIDGNVALFQFNIKLNVDHIAAGTYFEFIANIQALKSVINYDTMFIRAGIDCLVYGRLQNATSTNSFDIMLYFTNDYNRDPSISGDIILYYIRNLCVSVVIIFMLDL